MRQIKLSVPKKKKSSTKTSTETRLDEQEEKKVCHGSVGMQSKRLAQMRKEISPLQTKQKNAGDDIGARTFFRDASEVELIIISVHGNLACESPRCQPGGPGIRIRY